MTVAPVPTTALADAPLPITAVTDAFTPSFGDILAPVPPPALKSNVGVLVYPEPGLLTVREVIIPPLAVAVRIAPLPPPPETPTVN